MIMYRGVWYYLIADQGNGVLEIAPTKHGAGSFYVFADFCGVI